MEAGIVFGYERLSDKKEKIYCINNNTHTIGIGATRSGKSRCLVLQSIGLLGLAGESMVITDPKDELYDYTSSYLEELGYELRTLDFKDTRKSDRYNFLQPVIDALEKGDIQDAIDNVWDITESLMPDNDKGEPIWKNGEASIIASSIFIVCFENINKYKYQNLANVYRFIIEMAVYRNDDGGNPYILFEKLREYLNSINHNHPAIDLLAMSEIAHAKTRSSFYTSALTTLKLFTNLNINSITSDTTINLKDIGRKKVALFIILPDEKETYYSIASLFVHQLYVSLVAQADKLGGKLRQRVNFLLEEFGNFTKIPNMSSKLTVSGSRNIRFNLFIQSFKQLEEKYGKEVASIIRYNCENWIYLQTDDMETLEEISKRLGKFTTSSYSISSNQNNGGSINTSTSSGSSVNLIARDLLSPDEIKKIKRPYLLYLSRLEPAVMYCPDISLWNFNTIFSMGDEKHNTRLRFLKNMQRENKNNDIPKVYYWDEIITKLNIYLLEKKMVLLNKAIESVLLEATAGDTKALQKLQAYKQMKQQLEDKLNDLKFTLNEQKQEVY